MIVVRLNMMLTPVMLHGRRRERRRSITCSSKFNTGGGFFGMAARREQATTPHGRAEGLEKAGRKSNAGGRRGVPVAAGVEFKAYNAAL
jgi:hypothetical protein